MINIYRQLLPDYQNLPKADLVFCDPPYNQGVKYADDTSEDDLKHRYFAWCGDVLQRLADEVMRPNATLWWLCPSSHMDIIPYYMRKADLEIVYRIVKQETFAQYQQRSLTDDYRMLFCATRGDGPMTFNPNAIRIPSVRNELGDPRGNPEGRVPGQVWNFRRLQGTSKDRVDWHPTQLPSELLKRIVLGWSNEGDTVLDAFAGSGNMGLVCRELKRNCILVDQSPTYCKKMAKRLGLTFQESVV